MTTTTLYAATQAHIAEMQAREQRGTLPRKYFDTNGQKHLRTLRVTARLADTQAKFEEYKATCICEGWAIEPRVIRHTK